MNREHGDNLKLSGQIDVSIFDTTSPEASAVEEKLGWLISRRDLMHPDVVTAMYRELMDKLRSIALVRTYATQNLVTTVGRSVLAQRLAATTTYTGTINYGALGSSATAVANGDTQLGTEVFRKTVASATYSNNIAYIDFFYTKADTNGTYQEFGTFIDGSAGANTGQLFNHALTGGWTKTSSESMTVALTFTLS